MKKLLIMAMLFAIAIAGISFSSVQAEENSLPTQVEDDVEAEELKAEPRESKPVPTLYTNNNSATSTLERILSPDQIRFFKMIKKDGNALYGVRIDKPEAALNKPVKATNTAVKTDDKQSKLEKIAHPSFLNLYEKIQRLGNALWGVKKDAPKASSTPRVITADISACVITAIEKKDNALKARIETSNTELKSAIDARTSCQKNAFSSTVKQFEALKICNDVFQKSHESILKLSKEAQKSAWTVYQTELKACGANSATSTPIIIEDGGSNVMEALVQ